MLGPVLSEALGQIEGRTIPAMSRSAYRDDYLGSEGWRLRRILAIEAAGRRCQDCGWGDRTRRFLDVHHLSYARLGDELARDLVVVCRRCHRARHGEDG
jgi:predicted HNH restriction endonuclease